MKDITSRLDNIAEVLVESKDYSQFCHAIYEASNEITRLRAQVAAGDRLREAADDYYKASTGPEYYEAMLRKAIDAYDAALDKQIQQGK